MPVLKIYKSCSIYIYIYTNYWHILSCIQYLSTDEHFGHSNIFGDFNIIRGILDYHWEGKDCDFLSVLLLQWQLTDKQHIQWHITNQPIIHTH